jgi:hypothetical protein
LQQFIGCYFFPIGYIILDDRRGYFLFTGIFTVGFFALYVFTVLSCFGNFLKKAVANFKIKSFYFRLTQILLQTSKEVLTSQLGNGDLTKKFVLVLKCISFLFIQHHGRLSKVKVSKQK